MCDNTESPVVESFGRSVRLRQRQKKLDFLVVDRVDTSHQFINRKASGKIPLLSCRGTSDHHSVIDALHRHSSPSSPIDAPRLIANGAKVISHRFLANGDIFADRMIRENLRPGDVIAFSDDEKVNSDGTGNYKHMVLVVGNPGLISCHTTSQFGISYKAIKHGHMTLLKLP